MPTHKSFIVAALIVVCGLAVGRADALTPQPMAPRIVVPKCKQPPTIDGNIDPAEWRQAAAYTGFVLWGAHHTLDPRQVVAYITYDDTNLYMAFDLPIYPKGAPLYANFTTRDVGEWNGDDLLEVLLDPFDGKHRNEESYFQFMGNSKDYVLYDKADTPGLGLFNRVEWNGHWTFHNKITPQGRWHSELSIPLRDLGVDKIVDGSRWLVQFSRTWGAKVDWTTISSQANVLNVPGKGATLVFESHAPTVRLLGVEPLFKGRLGASGQIINSADAPREFIIEASAFSGDKQVAAKTLTLKLGPGQAHDFNIDQPAPGLGQTDLFHLSIRTPGVTLPWMETAFPFNKTPVYPIFPDVVPAKFIFESYYLPSRQELWIDKLSFRSFAQKQKVKQVRLTVTRQGKTLLEEPLKLKNEALSGLAVSLKEVVKEAGDYVATVSLINDKNSVLASETKSFHWQELPFMESPVPDTHPVLPPFTPLVQHGLDVSVIGRKYMVDDLGLFSQISATQAVPTVGKATERLLSRPMMLSMVDAAGTRSQAVGEGAKLVSADKIQATYTAVGKLGALALSVRNHIEYDGLAWITIELKPDHGPVHVGTMTLDIPMRQSQATLLHEVTDAIRRRYAGFTPAGKGVVWDSTRLLNTNGTLGNFKPLYWLGNEDRGLCWTGESDKGWYLDESKPAIEVIRQGDEVILRLNLVNRPLLLDKPRTISFGVQATPVKPMPVGWRGWVAPYGPREFKDLTYFNFGPVGTQRLFAITSNAPYPADWAVAKKQMDRYRSEGTIPFLYEVMRSGSPDPSVVPEFKVFQDEWKYVDNAAESFINFRAWALNQYLTRCGLFAFYEDNAYVTPIKFRATGMGYEREDGQYQGEFPIRTYRELLRRLAEVYYQLGMPNYVGVHKSTTMMPPVYSFATFAIDGEQRFMTSPDTDYIDQFPLDYYRASIMGRQFGFVPIFLSEINLGSGHEEAVRRGTRSEYALHLLHGVMVWPAHDIDKETVQSVIRAKGEFDLGAGDVVFHPYWESDKVVSTNDKNAYVTLWKRPGKAMMVVANLGEQQRITATIDLARLGITPTTATDMESNKRVSFKDGAVEVDIPRHDFRLIELK